MVGFWACDGVLLCPADLSAWEGPRTAATLVVAWHRRIACLGAPAQGGGRARYHTGPFQHKRAPNEAPVVVKSSVDVDTTDHERESTGYQAYGGGGTMRRE